MSFHNYEIVLGRCIDSLRTCKELSVKYLNDDAGVTSLIDNLTKQYNEANFEKEKADRALLKVKNDINDAQNVDLDVEVLHKKYVDEDDSELVHTETDIWKEVFSNLDIQEVHQRNETLSDAAFDRVDDSLLCSNVFEPPLDPISKILIREPYKNSVCGHYFDYETILSYIKERKGRAKCPYMGCANSVFRAEHLRPDHRMKELISQYLQNHDNTAELSEDD